MNIDLFPPRGGFPDRQAAADFRRHDLRSGLPLPAESCDLIYSSHFMEHLKYADGLRIIQDSYRALRPTGVFRLAIPDFRRVFEAYVRGEREYFDLVDIRSVLPEIEPGTETLVDWINYTVYQFGEHVCIHDEEKLTILLTRAGFRNVHRSVYRPGVDADSELRRRYSLYMEATK